MLAVACAGVVGVTRAAGEWQPLFNGRDLAAWKTYGKPDDAPVGWAIEGDTLAWRKGAGDLATKELFGNFELELEWKISPGGNSGVMFGVDEKSTKPWHSGVEIQVLDNGRHKDAKNLLTSAGALYSLYPPAKPAAKPVGEWNTLRIRLEKRHVQTWLNGTLTIDAQIGSDDWNARVAKSKFAPFAQFARVHPGRILLQNHGNPVWFRSIRVRRL
ncbi:MAG: DUF1080 domain-containing protein [Opitutaceae bacterium]|nr:DUF1080 domain-containing protein [Opitutaceae bacterium]